MEVLKKSRKELLPGDIFVFKLKSMSDLFWYGRVVRTDARVGGFEDTVLIYIYNLNSASKEDIPELSRRKLLVPPIATNKRPWTMGYFETVANRPLTSNDMLRKHVFKDATRLKVRFYDDNGKEVNKFFKPGGLVGCNGLGSFRTIDDDVSGALGIPLSED